MGAFWGMVGIGVGGLLQVPIEILRRTFEQKLEKSKREQDSLENPYTYHQRNALQLQRLLPNWARTQAVQTEVNLPLIRVSDTELRTQIDKTVDQVEKLHIVRMQASHGEYLPTRYSHFLDLSRQLAQVMELIGTHMRENLEPKL